VVRGRNFVPLRAEQPLEPTVAQRDVGGRRALAGLPERGFELAERDALLFLVSCNRIGLPGDLTLELLDGLQQFEALVVEIGAPVGGDRPELLAVLVVGQYRQPGLGRTERQLLVLELDARGEDGVLERVLALGHLARDVARLARLAQTVEPLALVALRRLILRGPQRIELLAGEQVAEPVDDLRPLGDLLLPHADRAALLGPLEQVAAKLRLVLGRCPNSGDAHGGQGI
jgi:hypothetical protein